MNLIKQSLLVTFILTLGLAGSAVQAAPRDAGKADSGAVLKLQSMVKNLTGERDAAVAEKVKLAAEIEELKKEKTSTAAAAAAASAAKEQLDADLAAQVATNGRVQESLEKTTGKLREVTQKYNELNQAKNQLGQEFSALTAKQQETELRLTTCGEHNIKLYQSGKDLLDRYQTKGTFAGLLQDEPILQFNSVEMENIIQEYEDKLRAGQYKDKPETQKPEIN